MTTTQQAKAQRMLDEVRAGRTVFTRAADGTWMVVGPTAQIVPGAQVTVTKADGTTSTVEIAALGVSNTKDGVDYTVATFRNVRTERPRTEYVTPQRVSCGGYHETDNHGRCYACGTYVAADDAGRTIRRYRIAR